MKKYTLQEVKDILNDNITMTVSGLDGMIQDDPDNNELYRSVLRFKDTKEDINNILDDLIETNG